MKVRILNWILVIDILSILLVFAVFITPSSTARIVLGLPFLLFFPGYVLTEVLFVSKRGIDHIERIALSIGTSISITALIGFGLNHSPYGIQLETALYSIFCFVIVTSAIALIRQRKLTTVLNLRPISWEGKKPNKTISILLIVLIIGAFGVLGYMTNAARVAGRFTEFYVLDYDGKAQDYPTELIMTKNKLTQVKYGDGSRITSSKWAEVILGIANQEQQNIVYSVRLAINDEPVNVNIDGTIASQLGPIELKHGEKWEQEIGFAPNHAGDNQKVEFFLFKDSNIALHNSLSLWINVKEVME